MKKIINGRRYDTDSAREIWDASYGARTDFSHWSETLYRKSTGEYFLYGEGGPMSRYAEATGQNEWSGGEMITPLSIEAAQKWAEKHMPADEYEKVFGAVEEDLTKRTVTFSLTEATIEKISQTAVRNGCSKSEVVERVMALIQL